MQPHYRNLRGTPDIVFRAERMAVFLHGCYWHRYASCFLASHPKKDREAWTARFEETVRRDQRVDASLRADGWWVYIACECDILRRPATLAKDAARFLSQRRASALR